MERAGNIAALSELIISFHSNYANDNVFYANNCIGEEWSPKHVFPFLPASSLVSQVLPTSSSSQMITFTFSNGGVATMRTSGTEPKIKYYTELCAAPGNR